MGSLLGWDNELDFDTQLSSQWDSLCHVTNKSHITYNNAKATQETLESQPTTSNPLPTLEHWHSRWCIVSRGVLIDFKTYIEDTTSTIFDPLSGHNITVDEIETVAKYQGVELKPVDILIVRAGYTEMLVQPTAADFGRGPWGGGDGALGVE